MHTPTPWKFCLYATTDDPAMLRSLGLEPVRMLTNDGSARITDADGSGIVSVDCLSPYKRGLGHKSECATRDANAAFIVDAVNAYDEHVARIGKLEAGLQMIASGGGNAADAKIARKALEK